MAKKTTLRPWFIRLGFCDEAFIGRVKKAAEGHRMTLSEYVTHVLEKEVGEMPVHGKRGFR